MKKILLIFLLYPVIFFGQDKSFELGLLFGGSVNSFNGESEYSKKTFQPVGGVLMQYNFNHRFSLKSKLLYHIKGGEWENVQVDLGIGTAVFDHTLNFHYATLPLLAQWNFGKDRWRVFYNIGSYIGYLTRVENIFEGGGNYINDGNRDLFEMDYRLYKELDYGLILGSGLSFQMRERVKIFLELSFDHSLDNVSERSPVALTQAITGSIGMAYNFPIKKKTFNGTSTLKCADYNEEIEVDEKKKSKWRLVLYKDGKRVGKKSKRGKSRLFKKKN